MIFNKKQTFLNKIRLAFISIVFIPVLILGSFTFYFASRYLNEQYNIESNNIIKQNIIDLNNKISACEKSLIYLSANYDLQMYLLNNDKTYDEQNREKKNIGNLLYNVMLTNQYYKNISIYTKTPQPVLTEFFKPLSQIKSKLFYKKVLNSNKIMWDYEDEKIYIRKVIKTAYPEKKLGIISIEINKLLFTQSFTVFNEIPIQITVKDKNNTIYMYKNTNFNNNIGSQKNEKLANTNFNVTYDIDNSYYKQYFITGLFIAFIVIFFVFSLTWVVIYFTSKTLVKDLNSLVNQVNIIQSGDFDCIIKSSNITEISILANSIQSLINKIKQLIKDVYAEEIKRKELEINLLQSKIKPHFLYNNLSAINWIALEHGQNKIYEIATELASFYRTSLNNGKNMDKLSLEIENIKSYLNLQLISHEQSFNVVYEIDETLCEQIIPIFIMQPLVENAIEYGIEQLRDEKGLIKITVQQNENLINIHIFDNGKELYKKIGENILNTNYFGYGTSNVYKRLKLIYNKQAGLIIKSNNNGTTATIYIPKDYNKWIL